MANAELLQQVAAWGWRGHVSPLRSGRSRRAGRERCAYSRHMSSPLSRHTILHATSQSLVLLALVASCDGSSSFSGGEDAAASTGSDASSPEGRDGESEISGDGGSGKD